MAYFKSILKFENIWKKIRSTAHMYTGEFTVLFRRTDERLEE